MQPLTVLCIASYEKGHEFMRECRRQGCRVILLTSKSLEHADWPRDSIDQIYFIPDVNKEWNMQDVIYGVSFLARTELIDRIVALDDFDVEKAASLREHLRIPGMGDTTARFFRDKLAMRRKAKDVGIRIPEFVHVLNHQQITDFTRRVQPPYVLKPRLQAGAIGIKKIQSSEQLWQVIHELGDQASFYVLEQFVPGDVYHVDTIIYHKDILFAEASQYGLPPMEVSHQGRVFSTRTVPRGSADEKALKQINRDVLHAFGILHGVSHSEYIKASHNGQFYFLETSARVGGAHIAELVEASSGVNLWAEWAKIEVLPDGTYKMPEAKKRYAGLMVSLAKQEWPDMSAYSSPEIVWRMNKHHHAGLIVASPKYERVEELLKEFTTRFYDDFFASHPAPEKPTA